MEQTAKAKYRDALGRPRPQHGIDDAFSLRHPKMPLSQRAKLFSPFAALRGFEEAIESKLERYVSRVELNEEDQSRLNRTLAELAGRVKNSRQARLEPVRVRVTFYVPCADENHEAYGLYGKYETLCGRVWRIDPVVRKALQVGETVIEFADILELGIVPGEEDG